MSTYYGSPYYISYNLNEFHIYTLEWNTTRLIWKIDGQQKLEAKLDQIFTKEDNKPFEKKFRLVIFQGVGGYAPGVKFFPDELTVKDVYHWNCSAMIIDYVRYYHASGDNNTEHGEVQDEEDNSSIKDICQEVMNKTRIAYNETENDQGKAVSPQPPLPLPPIPNSNLAIYLSVSSTLILLLVIPLIFWFVVRMKRQTTRTIQDSVRFKQDDLYENYDDYLTDNYYAEPVISGYTEANNYIALDSTHTPRYLDIEKDDPKISETYMKMEK